MKLLWVAIRVASVVTAVPLAAHAQATTNVFRVGYLGVEPAPSAYLEAFRDGLRRLGYVEGRNVTVESRLAEGKTDRLPALASELAGLRVDVIVGMSGPTAEAAKKASPTIRLVAGLSGDPVEAGLVSSLARPGGNITGMSYLQPELAGKRLQLLKEVSPQLTRVAVLMNPSHAGENQEWRVMDVAAKTIGVTLENHMMPADNDLSQIFAAITRDRAEAILLVPGADDEPQQRAARRLRRQGPAAGRTDRVRGSGQSHLVRTAPSRCRTTSGILRRQDDPG